MIRIRSNISVVSSRLVNKLTALRNPQALLRPVAIAMLPLFQERIHDEGKAADGNPIGTYSRAYLSYRKANGRGGGSRVIASFTRQLQNSYNVVATANGWAIGILTDGRNPLNNYLNKKNPAKNKKSSLKNDVTNSQLVNFLEATYKKKIFQLTAEERGTAINLLKEEIQNIINS